MTKFIDKTKYKIRLAFTNPKKFFRIIHDMTKVAFVKKIDTGPEGSRWTRNNEINLLKKYAKQAKVGIVEIGILDGGTTKEMATVANVPMYGIDPLIPDSMNKRLIGTEEKIVNNLKFYPEFTFFKDYSFNVVKNWSKPFDFIFIDGDHTYEAVKQDFEDWLPLNSSGGYIAFHDSHPIIEDGREIFAGWPGCVQLVNELRNDNRVNFIEVADSITVFQKK